MKRWVFQNFYGEVYGWEKKGNFYYQNAASSVKSNVQQKDKK